MFTSDWKTRASAQTGAPAQEVINEQALSFCDYLFIVFKFRFGTPTNKYESGTVHEYEWFKENKPLGTTSLYFSSLTPPTVDDQYKKVLTFKKKIETTEDGLYKSFDTEAELQREIDVRLSYLARTKKISEKNIENFITLISETRKRAKEVNEWESREYGYYEIAIYPQDYSENKFSIEQIQKLLFKMRTPELDNMIPYIVLGNPMDFSVFIPLLDGIESYRSKIDNLPGSYFYYLNFKQSGLFYLRMIMTEDRERDKRAYFLAPEYAVRFITLAIASLLIFYESEDSTTQINLNIRFEGLKGRSIGFSELHRCSIEEFPIKKSYSYAGWKKVFSEYESIKMAKELFIRFGISDGLAESFRKIVDEIRIIITKQIGKKVHSTITTDKPADSLYKCPECNERFDTPENLNYHQTEKNHFDIAEGLYSSE